MTKSTSAGHAEGLRLAISSLCTVLDIAVDGGRAAFLDILTVPELEALHERLLRERSWR